MKKVKFSVDINASPEKTWKTLWDDITYRKWTSAFSEGSHAVTDWKEGSKVHFIGTTGEGMYSMIAKKVPNEFMSFRHIGVMKDGKELPLDEESRKWSGAMENYKLEGNPSSTKLSVEMDVADEFENYFNDAFPKALSIVKDISESDK
jgi:uncharacterized protein YndB with AHSA1/START domain